ncbi:MAG: molybdopterin-dependent oxidoreductase [Ilumatobacteraceae bacterium]
MTEVRTFCRICEPSCGLVATVELGRVTALRADQEHPVTKGFACHKGIAALDVHDDPDRLSQPMRRGADGEWTAATWDDALGDIARRLDAITAEHGPDAVAVYTGNPTAFNALGTNASATLIGMLGTRRTFNSGTQDCANKFAASQAVFGTTTVHPIPDVEHTDLCIIIGENPRASQASFWSISNVMGELRSARGRGARIVFVNPRRVERPERGVGDTIQLQPDTDVYFLASLLHEIDLLGGFDERVVAWHGSNVDGLRAFVAAYPAERTARVTGVDPAVVRELAAAWVVTPRASVHASTGLNMGRQGTLAYWLVHMLAFATGRLDVEGGNLKSDGFYPNAKAGAAPMNHMYVDSEFGRVRRGGLPGTLMSHAILDSDQPLKALIVLAGNPVLSIGGEDRLRKAFEQLDLLVCVDLYRNATGELAHWVLPATDELEREDLNIVNIGTSHRPFAQYTPAVVEPAGERKPEWWIVAALLQKMGRPSLLDDETPDPWAKWRHMLARRGIDLAALADEVHVVEPPAPGRFYDEQVQTPDGRVDCCPAAFDEAIERCASIFDGLAAEPAGRLKMITKRDQWMHNSWFSNLERMKRSGRTLNPLGINPADAARHGVADGDVATLSNEWGAIDVVVKLDDDLLPGVVSLVHGWGHAKAPGMRVAHRDPGVNPNALLPVGPGSFEPLSSQSHMTGIPVELTAHR